MTKPSSYDPLADPLPGLGESPSVTSDLEASVRRTIAAIDAAGLLTERDAATCQLAIELARVVQLGVASRRSTGAAMAARELRDTLLMLPQPEQTPAGQEWDALVRKLVEADEQ
jgi:hypothetical protein